MRTKITLRLCESICSVCCHGTVYIICCIQTSIWSLWWRFNRSPRLLSGMERWTWLVRQSLRHILCSTSSGRKITRSELVYHRHCQGSHASQDVLYSFLKIPRPGKSRKLKLKDDRQRFLQKVSKKQFRTVYYNANACV